VCLWRCAPLNLLLLFRLAEFFRSWVMGAALKVSDSNRSAWIVDGGSNGGVMKLAGDARHSMRSIIGRNVPLIGISVAIDQASVSGKIDLYEIQGHSHLILAVDPEGGCPKKVRARGIDLLCWVLGGYQASHSCFLSWMKKQTNSQ